MIAYLDCQKMISKEKILGSLPTNGEVYKRAFQIAWLSALETILVALIGAIDTMMVGGL